jgi:hypothetical protein
VPDARQAKNSGCQTVAKSEKLDIQFDAVLSQARHFRQIEL